MSSGGAQSGPAVLSSGHASNGLDAGSDRHGAFDNGQARKYSPWAVRRSTEIAMVKKMAKKGKKKGAKRPSPKLPKKPPK
jgi:hypothetical protein